MNKPTLSVTIVTLNEAHNIRACLESVAFADEIIVLDSGSTDDTLKIAREFTDKVLVSPWTGCGPQKLKALEMATCDWVLCLDADERVSPALKDEILETLAKIHAKTQDENQIKNQPKAFEIPFHSYYCGKRIRFGDWSNEKHLRLFHRNSGTIVPRLIHFRIEIEDGKKPGVISRLKNPILHYSFPSLNDVLRKVNTYSTDGAKMKFQAGKKAGLGTALLRGLWAFLRGYVIRFGFLDGREGFLLAISNAEGVYYRYLKLFYMNLENDRIRQNSISRSTV